jgi:hypothetical protein
VPVWGVVLAKRVKPDAVLVFPKLNDTLPVGVVSGLLNGLDEVVVGSGVPEVANGPPVVVLRGVPKRLLVEGELGCNFMGSLKSPELDGGIAL